VKGAVAAWGLWARRLKIGFRFLGSIFERSKIDSGAVRHDPICHRLLADTIGVFDNASDFKAPWHKYTIRWSTPKITARKYCVQLLEANPRARARLSAATAPVAQGQLALI
jgi:hypothetical protein